MRLAKATLNGRESLCDEILIGRSQITNSCAVSAVDTGQRKLTLLLETEQRLISLYHAE